MTDAYKNIELGEKITGSEIIISQDKIVEFAEVTLDYNPLHLDEKFMETTSFGKTKYKGIIGHGLLNFGLINKLMTDWLWPRGGIFRRMETKHINPVYPNDILLPKATVVQKIESPKTRWVIFEIEMRKQKGGLVLKGEATGEFPNSI